MNHIKCVIKRDVYPQKMHSCSKNIRRYISFWCKNIRGINRRFFFFVKDRNLFHPVNIIGNIFTSGAATSENITDAVHEMK